MVQSGVTCTKASPPTEHIAIDTTESEHLSDCEPQLIMSHNALGHPYIATEHLN